MAAPFQPRDLYDGLNALPMGVNSGVAALLLQRNQASFAINCTFRGSFATDRPPVDKLTITWPSDEVQTAVEQGLFQGAGFYRPDFGASSLFASISGRIFQFQLDADGVTVTERTPTGDPNPATTTQVWMWQSENYLIVNDGVSLPIFIDASTSRRSDGGSQTLELTAVDWIIPAIGSTVAVTLNAPYTGPYNRLIYVDGFFYQAVENANVSYNVTLTNLTATPGGTIAIGTEAVVEPSKLGEMTSAAGVSITSGSFAPNTFFAAFNISYPYTGPNGVDLLINGRIWRITDILNGGFRLAVVNRFTIVAPGYSDPIGTLVQLAGSSAPSVSLGTVVTAFVIPAVGGSVQAELTLAYSGADGASVWIDDEQYTITAVPPPSPTNSVFLLNIDDTNANGVKDRGPTGSEGVGQLSTVDELPPGRQGAYGMGRNVMALVDGQSFIVGDIVGGGSGTPANNYRDAVLKITENTFELGGGVFRIPGSAGDIRAIIFPAVLDAAFGQGSCQILTPDRCFSINLPVDRTTWQTVTNPILTQSLISNGGQGQNSTITVEGDIQFRSVDGWRSLVFGRRQFTDVGGNTPMSHEVDRIIIGDDIALLNYGSAVYFDSRVLWTAHPQTSSQGVFHNAIVSQNKDPQTSIGQKEPPIYDGLWTGLNVLQLVAGKSLGSDRCFAFSLNIVDEENPKIEVYELKPSATENFDGGNPVVVANYFDNGNIPITKQIESPPLFVEDPAKRTFKRLVDGEIEIDNVLGTVAFQIFYRATGYPCWWPWHSWSLCAQQGTGLQPGFFPRVGFGEPSASNCDSFTNRPAREGYSFQVKLLITGKCRVLAVNLRATTQPEPVFAKMVCAPCAE